MAFIIAVLLFCVCVALLLGLVILYARWNYNTLEALGVPVVKPTFLFGSLPALHSKVVHEEDIKHFKTHGSIYGVYEGRHPILFVCDPELIKKITVTDFEHFRDRRRMDFGDEYFNEMFDFLKYEKWKVVRGHLLPAFSPAKFKRMRIGMDVAMNSFLRTLEEKCGVGERATVDIREVVVNYNVAFSAQNLYGLEVKNPADKNHFLRVAAEESLGENHIYGLFYSLSLTFPILTEFVPTFPPLAINKFKQFVALAMAERKRLTEAHNNEGDFLDRLNSLLDQVGSEEFKKLEITEITVYAQAMILFLVSYDVLTSGLVFLFYFLAKNPNCQKTLQTEIDSFFDTHKTVVFGDLFTELPYLEACIKETLRLFPVQRRLERVCVKDYQYKNLKIKKGLDVMVPLFPYHRNPDYFENPDEFQPERFLQENISKMHPYACSPFGHGPRGCGGPRYSMEVLKYSAAHILHNFSFEANSKTKIVFKTGRRFLVQYYPISLDVVKRGTYNYQAFPSG